LRIRGLGGLADAKQERLLALSRHDHAKAAEAQQEILDLTWLAAEFADGLALSRARHLAAGRAWPLAPLGVA
jgi:hypothetical protein